MLSTSPTRVRLIWLALPLLLVACGGGASQTASTNPAETPTTIASEPDGAESSDAAPATSPAGATSDPPPTSDAPPPDPPAGSSPAAKLSDWENWQPATFDVAAPDDPNDIQAQLQAMYSDLIKFWTADNRIAALTTARSFERYDDTPASGHIEAIGTEAVVLADSFALVAAHSAANAGGPGEPFFGRRATGFSILADFQQEVRTAAAEFVDAGPAEQFCFVQALNDRCDDGRAGEVADQLFDRSDELRDQYDDLNIDDAGSDLPRPPLTADGVGQSLNCVAWEDAVAANGLTATQEFAIFVAIDDSLLDTRVIGLSECEWESTREEDPVFPEDADSEMLAQYAEAIVAAGVADGFSYDEYEAAYDAGTEAELQADARAAIILAATQSAAELWQSATHPYIAGRLFLVTWSGDWHPEDREELDWDDAEEAICEAYETALAARDATAAEIAHDTIRQLELDNLLIADSCSPSFSDDDSG